MCIRDRHDATRVIPAKLAVARNTHITGNLMFGSHETEFEDSQNYTSQVDQLRRSPGQVFLQRRYASSGQDWQNTAKGQCNENLSDILERPPPDPSTVEQVCLKYRFKTSLKYVPE